MPCQIAEKISGRTLEIEFLRRIANARSNLPQHSDARQIYEREVKPMRVDLRRVAGHYAVASLFDNFSVEESVYCYRVRQDDFETFRAGRAKMAMGSVTITFLLAAREEARFELPSFTSATELTGGVPPRPTPRITRP
jgi:hypothetical protein